MADAQTCSREIGALRAAMAESQIGESTLITTFDEQTLTVPEALLSR